MNRQQRRAERKAAWAAGLRATAEESGGLMDLSIITPAHLVNLIMASAEGDPEATRLARAFGKMLGRVNAPAEGEMPALCGCCDNLLTDVPYSVVIASPSRDDPARAIVIGVCADCAVDPSDIARKSVDAFRRVFPDARPVTLQGHAGGRA